MKTALCALGLVASLTFAGCQNDGMGTSSSTSQDQTRRTDTANTDLRDDDSGAGSVMPGPTDATQQQRDDRAEGRSIMPPPAPGNMDPNTDMNHDTSSDATNTRVNTNRVTPREVTSPSNP